MKERPILFSAPMVRAILDSTKTQTRRVLRPQPPGSTTDVMTWHHPDDERKGAHFWSWGPDPANPGRDYIQPDWAVPCPYGEPGDRLWVREKWRIGSWDDGCGFWIDYRDGPRKERVECNDVDLAYRLIEQTGEDLRRCNFQPTNGTMYEWKPGQSPLRWRPSIHMPRWASRITLEITAVRVERLQDISEADALAEGVSAIMDEMRRATPRCDFQALWQSINGPDSWDANPWVFVIEFQRVLS